MKTFEYPKTINTQYFLKELKQIPEVKPYIKNINRKGDKIWVMLDDTFDDSTNKAKIDAAVTAHDEASYNVYLQVDAIINDAERFAEGARNEFMNENIRLGITQLGLTNHVRKTLEQVIGALGTASLYDARFEIAQVVSTDLDAQVLTAARLLTFRQQIEEYLGITPLAAVYDGQL